MGRSAGDRRQLTTLLKIAAGIDVVGDVSVTVSSPAELLAWAQMLPDPIVLAWRSEGSGHRFVSVTAFHERSPIHGNISIVLDGNRHIELWDALLGGRDLDPGEEALLDVARLAHAWNALPLSPPEELSADVEPDDGPGPSGR